MLLFGIGSKIIVGGVPQGTCVAIYKDGTVDMSDGSWFTFAEIEKFVWEGQTW